MPEVRASTPADRAKHFLQDTRYRLNGDVIPTPDDLFEGGGDLVSYDKEGNPLRADGTHLLTIQKTEQRDGWYAYAGRSPQGVDGPTKQQASPFPANQNSWAAFQPIFQGDLPPTVLTAARLPRPLKPLMVVEEANVQGFAATTDARPDFLCLTFAKGGRHSKLSPSVEIPKIEQGQSIKAFLLDQIQEGVTHIGVWKTAPGTSTRLLPGKFFLQREVSISGYNPGSLDLTGPFRTDRAESGRNETQLPTPGKATLRFLSQTIAARPGKYEARVRWVDEYGASLPGPSSGTVTVNIDSYYETFDDQGVSEGSIAGRGKLRVERPPNPPPNAIGWRAEVFVEGKWHIIYYSRENLGNDVPLPISRRFAETPGWSSASENDLTKSHTEFLVQRDPETVNTSGIDDPTEAPEQPVVFGVVRPLAGAWYGFVTDTLRLKESLQSETASVTITESQTFRIVYQDETNLVPNPGNTEVGADALPLDQTTTVPEVSPGVPSGTVTVQSSVQSPVPSLAKVTVQRSEVVMQTAAAAQTVAPENATAFVKINRNRDWRVGVEMSAENPQEGIFTGSAEAVLQEKNAAGTITSTVLFSLASPGHTYHTRTIWRSDKNLTGLPGSIKWASTSTHARILVRYSGATKNLTIRVGERALAEGKHHRRKRPRRPFLIGEFDVPDSTFIPPPPDPGLDPGLDPVPDPVLPPDPQLEVEVPPGGGAGPSDPPEVPPPPEPIATASPTLVVWPSPERPDATGALLEPVHDFEIGLPAGWTQHIAGNGTLSRQAGAALTGSFGLRSQKTVAGP